jgi:hypothetical protein
VLLIEVLSAGPSGPQRHEQTIAMLAEQLGSCSSWQPGRCPGLARGELAQAAIGAMMRIVQHKLVTEGGEELPALLPALLALATRVTVAA